MIKFNVAADEKEYRDFEEHARNGSLLQSYEWASVKDNWEHVHYIGKDENGRVRASALALIKRLPLGYGMMYIPKGPVMEAYNEEDLKAFVQFLKQDARGRKVIFIKVDPPVTDKASVSLFEKAGMEHQGFSEKMSETIQPRLNAAVYDEPDWKKNLPKHTRRLIKDADKNGITIEFGGKELIDDLAAVVSKTESRKGVSLRDKTYFEKLMDAYPAGGVISIAYFDIDQRLADTEAEIAELKEKLENINPQANKKKKDLESRIQSKEKAKAKYEAIQAQGLHGKIPTAGILSIAHGHVYEMLYAGMDDTFKAFMPQYKQYVENFEHAFTKMGCDIANMGGIEFDADDGLRKFKSNFNPREIEYIGEFNIPVKPLLYPIANYVYKKRKNG